MRRTFGTLLMLAAATASASFAQTWEIGGFGGFGIANGLTASAPAGSAATGFRDGRAFGVLAGQNGRILGGELRYMQRAGSIQLSQGSTDVRFKALSHTIHYDALLHVAPQRAKIRPFFAFGGGVRVFRGTGQENAFQPLSSFVLLTKSQEVLPVLCLGAGVKVKLTDLITIRTEVRNFITTTPEGIITPSPGATISGWIHDIVPSVGISLTF